jgi:hypothetical protein
MQKRMMSKGESYSWTRWISKLEKLQDAVISKAKDITMLLVDYGAEMTGGI